METDQKKEKEKKNKTVKKESDRSKRGKLKARNTNIPWPPGKWRLGRPHSKVKYLFLRYATKGIIEFLTHKSIIMFVQWFDIWPSPKPYLDNVQKLSQICCRYILCMYRIKVNY